MGNFILKETMNTSTASLFSSNVEANDEYSSRKNSKDFASTLKQLSRYVLNGYKDSQGEVSSEVTPGTAQEEISVKRRRYYLDDEGDLSYQLDDASEFKKLSMLVHAILRLREVYHIRACAKPATGEHPKNLGSPQLRDAIENKPMSVVKDILVANQGVDINVRSQSGYSALHRAAIEGDIEVLRILIENGADVNIRDRAGFPPVHEALRHHHYKAAMFLMDCDADLVSYTSKRVQQFVTVKALAKQYLRQTLKTPL